MRIGGKKIKERDEKKDDQHDGDEEDSESLFYAAIYRVTT
jgi:hypothetical protein